MNLYFRLCWLVLKHLLFRKHLEPFDTSCLKFTVLPSDLDLNLHMNNGRYLAMMDLGRFELMLRTGLFRKGVLRRWMPVIADLKIRYRYSLKAFQQVELHTRMVGWDRKWFYLEQRFEHRGRLMARALVKVAFVQSGRTLNAAEVVSVMGVAETPPPLSDEYQKGWVTRPGTRSLAS